MVKPKGAGKRSVCPVACALDVIGDRWTLLILRDLFVGKTHYREFLASPEGIATNILASRLDELAANGLIRATPSREREGSRSYRLTARGLFRLLGNLRNYRKQYFCFYIQLLQFSLKSDCQL